MSPKAGPLWRSVGSDWRPKAAMSKPQVTHHTSQTHILRFLLNALGVLVLLGKPPPNANVCAGVLHTNTHQHHHDCQQHVTRHTSHIIHHTSHITHHTSSLCPHLFMDKIFVSTSQSLRLPQPTAASSIRRAGTCCTSVVALALCFDKPWES